MHYTMPGCEDALDIPPAAIPDVGIVSGMEKQGQDSTLMHAHNRPSRTGDTGAELKGMVVYDAWVGVAWKGMITCRGPPEGG